MANPFANTIKFLNAINLLASPAGTTLQGLMNHLNISRRTAFRLLDALNELGFPLIDEQPKVRTEKTYRLLDSYVLKLPNISIPNPGFTGEEIELVLTILDLCKQLNQASGTPRLNAIREKIRAIKPKDTKKQ
jgi:predicted DNA-binding transcriptional regulator YafY